MSQPAYPNPFRFDAVFQRLQEATEHASHEFWPDDISLLDSIAFDRAVTPAGPQVTDLYLLALSVSHKGRFATFDRAVPLNVVLGSSAHHPVVLSE